MELGKATRRTRGLIFIAALVALQLIAGRRGVWLPARWRRLELGVERQRRFLAALMRVIVGLDDHTDGDVVIDGAVVNAVSPRQRDIAMVFSDFALHPHLDVYDNLAFGLKLRKTPKSEIDRRVKEAA